MTQEEQQRTLAGYKSNVHEQGDFDNINDGKPLLDDSVEYVFRLKEMPRVKPMISEKKDKNNNVTKIKVEKAICEFIEESTNNIVTTFFRVDSLNFSEEESYESGVIKFFRKLKNPLPEFKSPVWENHFIPGMRFRGRVVVKQKRNKDNEIVTNYYLDVPTCRPILESDKHPEAIASMKENALLANAKIIVHGCANSADAIQRLLDSKVTAEVMLAFTEADKAGLLKYPL